MVRLETPQEAHQAHSPFLGLAYEQVLLVVSSTDMKARVSSAYVKGLHKKSVSFPHSWRYNMSAVLPAPTFLGGKLPFGTVCVEPANSAEGWVHTVCPLHLEMFSHSQASPFYSSPCTSC